MYVPPTQSGDLVKNFTEKTAKTLGFRISHYLIKTRTTEAQKIFESTLGKRDNLKKACIYFYGHQSQEVVRSRLAEIRIEEFDQSLSSMRLMNYDRKLDIERSMKVYLPYFYFRK